MITLAIIFFIIRYCWVFLIIGLVITISGAVSANSKHENTGNIALIVGVIVVILIVGAVLASGY